MYSNNSKSVRDALCFFMDEEKGNEVGFIQFPQAFENITKNDVYSNSLNVTMEVSIKKLLIVFLVCWIENVYPWLEKTF